MMPQPSRERRRHVVYLTRNTEYHCCRQECVGVRDRQTGQWHRYHAAVRTRLVGSVGGDHSLSRAARVGARLCFAGDQTVMTTALQFVGRPDKSAVFGYASQTWAGVIDALRT